MKISLIQNNKKTNVTSFTISNTNAAYVNTIRRLIISEVPTMAIEDVEIRKNNSILYDEVLAHRLGLLPLTTDLKAYNLSSKCTCKGAGCAKCTLKLVIKGAGPDNLLSSNIKSKDPKVKPVNNNFLIDKLLEGQEVEAELIARLGTGKEHMKWSPGLIHYKNAGLVDSDDTTRDADSTSFDFFIESWGQLTPNEMIEQSILVFDDKLKKFDTLLKA